MPKISCQAAGQSAARRLHRSTEKLAQIRGRESLEWQPLRRKLEHQLSVLARENKKQSVQQDALRAKLLQVVEALKLTQKEKGEIQSHLEHQLELLQQALTVRDGLISQKDQRVQALEQELRQQSEASESHRQEVAKLHQAFEDKARLIQEQRDLQWQERLEQSERWSEDLAGELLQAQSDLTEAQARLAQVEEENEQERKRVQRQL